MKNSSSIYQLDTFQANGISQQKFETILEETCLENSFELKKFNAKGYLSDQIHLYNLSGRAYNQKGRQSIGFSYDIEYLISEKDNDSKILLSVSQKTILHIKKAPLSNKNKLVKMTGEGFDMLRNKFEHFQNIL